MLFSSSLVSFALCSASVVLGAAPIPTSTSTSLLRCTKEGDACLRLAGTAGVCDSSLTCVPKCGTAGAKRCSTKTKLQVCQSNGLWADSVDCSTTGGTCDLILQSGCRYCTESAKQCNGTSLLTCKNGAWTSASCGSYQCVASSLTCAVCTEGTKQCSGANVQTCINGAWSTTASCGTGYSCSSTSLTCVSTSGSGGGGFQVA